MKTRPFFALAAAACIGLAAWFLVAVTGFTTVPMDEFADTLRKQHGIEVTSKMSGAPTRLPLALRIRFSQQTSRAAIGFMDRSEITGLTYEGENIECTAHLRGGMVCHVTLNGDQAGAFRKKIQELFPGLSVD